MGQIKAIHQIAPAFPYGDAIGNQMFRIRELLRQWGVESQVYVQARDRRLADPGVDYAHYPSSPDNILIYHYSTRSALTEFVQQLPDQVIVYYHNVTPPEFFHEYDPAFAAKLEQGRRDVASFKNRPCAWAGSEYNRQDLLAMGFKHVTVVPYFLQFDELLVAADSPAGRQVSARYADGWTNLLFVGRLAPNKRQDDLIRVFGYYHRLVNPRSRLILVGSDANLPSYRFELEIMAENLAPHHIHLPGAVSFKELGGYYRAATVFVCLSEHEGFGIPLLEAMAFDVPVLAFNSTAVPYALGEAGILINRKHYDVIGELIDLLVHDKSLRRRVIRKQKERLFETRPAQAKAALRRALSQLGLEIGSGIPQME